MASDDLKRSQINHSVAVWSDNVHVRWIVIVDEHLNSYSANHDQRGHHLPQDSAPHALYQPFPQIPSGIIHTVSYVDTYERQPWVLPRD